MKWPWHKLDGTFLTIVHRLNWVVMALMVVSFFNDTASRIAAWFLLGLWLPLTLTAMVKVYRDTKRDQQRWERIVEYLDAHPHTPPSMWPQWMVEATDELIAFADRMEPGR